MKRSNKNEYLTKLANRIDIKRALTKREEK